MYPSPSLGDWWEISAADAAHWCAYWPLYSPGTGPQDLRVSHQSPPAVPLWRRRGRLLHGLRRTGHASEGEGENRDSVNATVSAISAFLCLCENKTMLGKARAWTISGERREAEMTQLSWLPYPGYLVIQKTGFRGLKAHFLLSSCLSDPTPSFSLTIVHCLFGGKMRQCGFPPFPNLHLSWNDLCFSSTQTASPFPLPNSSIW